MIPNEPVIRRWVEALRSGDYEQGQSNLRAKASDGKEKFCCLGVLCELAAEDGIVPEPQYREYDFAVHENQGRYFYDGDGALPPWSVAQWVGIDYDRELPSPDTLRAAGLMHPTTLYGMNDNGAPFEEIADLIEAEYLRTEK